LKRGWPDYERHGRPIMALRKVAQGVWPRTLMAAADGTGGTEQEGRNRRGGGGLSRQIASRDGGTRSGGFAQSKTRMRLVGGFKC